MTECVNAAGQRLLEAVCTGGPPPTLFPDHSFDPVQAVILVGHLYLWTLLIVVVTAVVFPERARSRRLHDPATCSQCQNLRIAVELGEVRCHGGGQPCELCLTDHEPGVPSGSIPLTNRARVST